MATMASMQEELRCPITLEMLEDPVMCTACQQSFSRHAVRQHMQVSRRCPVCRAEPLRITPNRWAARLLDVVRDEDAAASTRRLEGMHFTYTHPYTIFVTGMFGAGKSTLINLMADPTGESDISVEDQTADGVTDTVEEAFNGNLQHRGSQIPVILVDTPGFGDPARADAETLKQLSQATVQMVAGMDSIVHVVKIGRMQEADRQLPQLLLAGLAPDDETRAELAKRWVFVVTHADSGRRPCGSKAEWKASSHQSCMMPSTEPSLWSTVGSRIRPKPTQMLKPIATRFWTMW